MLTTFGVSIYGKEDVSLSGAKTFSVCNFKIIFFYIKANEFLLCLIENMSRI